MVKVRPVISEEQYYAVFRVGRKLATHREDIQCFRDALDELLSELGENSE